MEVNYRNLFKVQRDLEKQLKQLCPDLDHKSGIYFWIRKEEGKNCAYIGKAKDLMKRSVSHLQGNKQRLDGSLKKRGLYSKDNTLGWQLFFLHFPEDQLDEKEQHFIQKYKDAGYEMYNIESGGTDGKTMIGERKGPMGYHDGLKKGYLNARKEVAHWFELHLDCTIKGKSNKNKEKALEKFKKFINIEEKEQELETNEENV